MHKAVLILWEIRVCWTSRGSCAPGSDDGGGGRRAINDGIEGKGGYLHNDWEKRNFGELPKNRFGFGVGVLMDKCLQNEIKLKPLCRCLLLKHIQVQRKATIRMFEHLQ